jgi:hypothetical protein
MNPNKTYQTNRRSQLAVILGLFAAGASPAGVVTLQPVDDAYLSSSGSEADQTFNGAVLDQFGYYSAYKRPLLKFDLSSIPDGATIVSARLTLGLQGIYGGQGHSTTLWRMPNDNWNETTVTWNTYTQAGAVAVASLPGTNDLGARVWDIQLAAWSYAADLADDAVTFQTRWETDGYGGWEGDGYYKANSFSSKEGTVAPQLRIEYTMEPPPALSIAHNDEQITLSWPAPADGWLLERSTRLDSGIWTQIPPPYMSGEGNWFVTLPRTGAPAAEFFRLHKP